MQSEGTILVVVVEPEVRAALRRCLEECHEVVTATSAAEALVVLDTTAVDLILCDQRMPDMSGVGFFSQTRISHPDTVRCW